MGGISNKFLSKARSVLKTLRAMAIKAFHEIVKFKVYHWGCLLSPFIRIYELPFGSLVVHGYESMNPQYTYQAFWYYTWSRVFDLFCFYTIARECRSVIFLFCAILCVGKIMDEGIYPFGFYFGEFVYWIAAAIILFVKWQRNTYWHVESDNAGGA